MTIQRWLLSLILIGTMILGGCTAISADVPSNRQNSMADGPNLCQKRKNLMTNLPCLEGKATVRMTVKGLPITIEVDGENAPITAGNFVDLVQRGVYDGLVFHRVVREPQPFVVQGGDPQGKDTKFPASRLGTGNFVDPATSKPRYIPLEIKPVGAKEPTYSRTLQNVKPELLHKRGAVAMARSNAPDSASSQFYFALADLPFLDGNYAVFGKVIEGMEIIDKIEQGDRIDSATIIQGAENLKK